jgi:hypothetical protein
LSAGIADGQVKGVFRPELSVDATATIVTAFVRGAVLRLFADPDEKWVRKASAQLLALLAVEPSAAATRVGRRPSRAKQPGPRRKR